MIYFVGAGPGASDLLTLRAADILGRADLVIYASSLVSRSVVELAPEGAQIYDSAAMTLEDVLDIYAGNPDKTIVRLHSGDPSLYGAIFEQIAWCQENQVGFEVVPGVSSISASSALLGLELTIPKLSQSVIITRLAKRTSESMPDTETIENFARLGATMAIFLSGSQPRQLQQALLGPGSLYTPKTPCAVVVRASWPDERYLVTTVGELAETMDALDARLTALVIVGRVVEPIAGLFGRSHLYSPEFSHRYRKRSLAGSTQGRPGVRFFRDRDGTREL